MQESCDRSGGTLNITLVGFPGRDARCAVRAHVFAREWPFADAAARRPYREMQPANSNVPLGNSMLFSAGPVR